MSASSALSCWTIRGRPLMAYAKGSVEDELGAVELFPATTLKRRLLAGAIWYAVYTRWEWRFSALREEADSLLPAKDLTMLLERLGGDGETDWLVTWPAQPERRRLYLIVRPREGGRISVAKIGAGEFNRQQLRNEAAALNKLAGNGHPFGVPAVLFEEDLAEGRRVLGMGGFPETFRGVSVPEAKRAGADVIMHLGAMPVAAATCRLSECGWYESFRERAPDCEAVRRLLARSAEEIAVEFAHGDLGPGNLLRDGPSGVLLFDWENASEQAPVGTDTVGLWMACRQRRILRNPARMARVLRACGPADPETALAFLCAHGNLAATRLLEGWA